MIRPVITSAQSGLHRIIGWSGWTPQDRRIITDICRQLDELLRRQEARAVELKKAGR